MNTFAKFCRDYHAIPVAYGRGVERIAYETATDAALIGHAEGNCRAWDDATLPAHVRLDVQNELRAIVAELWRRMQSFGLGGVDYTLADEPPAHAALRRAWFPVVTRLGYQGYAACR